MKNKIFILSIFTFVFVSCGPSYPKIEVKVVETCSAPPTTGDIKIYFSKEELPSDVKIIGTVSVTDEKRSADSKLCDSLSVIQYIKEEVRKTGGNAAFVVKIIHPDYWGSLCYQMTASIIYTDELAQPCENDTIIRNINTKSNRSKQIYFDTHR